ncbi:type VII secretion protein EccE [Mycobacterium sp. MYCO198283]|uniref:type VII secretion protein EccE n=1 Tax=Mycobacterium sp. MYCO198283 TaxID=2883505 RepID=UPI001E51E268|nr:type VII secretion protein EccE [Mycobacterium sp. MYCO198283]MCG5432083.1 type VII secretion protein EccE [Mycobacterium sp. MYCO198283]
MSVSSGRRPGTARLTVVALAVVAAVLAQPWSTVRERWVLGAAVAVVVLAVAYRRGSDATTLLRRRVALWRRRGSGPDPRGLSATATDVRTTVVAALAPAADLPDRVPAELLAGYLHRYGLRCEAVRIVSCDGVAGRSTWVGLTLSAAANLPALQARSAELPLQQTATAALRRLADHLRELGWEVRTVDADDVPAVLTGSRTARETWRGVADGDGHLAAYRIRVDDALPQRLTQVWQHPARQTWTVLELTGSPGAVTASAACAFRTDEQPGAGAPLAGLTPAHGDHRPVLAVIDPLSTRLLGNATPVSDADLAGIDWASGRRAALEDEPVSRT